MPSNDDATLANTLHTCNFLCDFFWSSTRVIPATKCWFLFFVCAAGIITGCIPSLEAFPKEVLRKKTIHNPRTQGSRSWKIKSLTSQGSTFHYILASDIPWVTFPTKEREEMEVAVLLGVSKVYFRFTDMEIVGGSQYISVPQPGKTSDISPLPALNVETLSLCINDPKDIFCAACCLASIRPLIFVIIFR